MTPETRAALALVAAGLPAAQVGRVLRMVDVDTADTAETIAAKVGSLTADVPGLFAPTGRTLSNGGDRGGRPADGAARGAARFARSTDETEYDTGVRLAREKYGHLRAVERGATRFGPGPGDTAA